MANTIVQAGNNTATFSVDPIEGTIGTLGRADWEALPESRLKTILFKSYPGNAAVALTAFMDAFTAAGGTVQVLARVGDSAIATPFCVWEIFSLPSPASDVGYPVLAADPAATSSLTLPSYFRIALTHSISE